MSVTAFLTARSPRLAPLATDSLIAIATMNTGDFGSDTIANIGTRTEYAIALRVLHMIVRDQIRDAGANQHGGVVSSESEGNLSVSMSLSEQDKRDFPDLCTTTWGVELISFIRGNFIAFSNSMIGV
jgi:hypothetical protein